VVQAFSVAGSFTDSPAAEARYRLRVRCSSQAPGSGCEDATLARVLVYPSDQVGDVVFDPTSVTCDSGGTGDPSICEPADAVVISFVKPSQAGTYDGFDLYRLDRGALASPVIDGAACAVPAVGVGAPVGSTVTVVESPPFSPPAGDAALFLVGHRGAEPPGPAPAGFARPIVTGTGLNEPIAPRFVAPACPSP
jgi:hypothetical protein